MPFAFLFISSVQLTSARISTIYLFSNKSSPWHWIESPNRHNDRSNSVNPKYIRILIMNIILRWKWCWKLIDIPRHDKISYWTYRDCCVSCHPLIDMLDRYFRPRSLSLCLCLQSRSIWTEKCNKINAELSFDHYLLIVVAFMHINRRARAGLSSSSLSSRCFSFMSVTRATGIFRLDLFEDWCVLDWTNIEGSFLCLSFSLLKAFTQVSTFQ